MQPNLHLKISIAEINMSAGFRYEAQFEIVNRGAHPIKTGEVSLLWQRDDNGELVTWPFREYKDRVIPGGESVSDRLTLNDKPGITEDSLGPLSDFMLLKVQCADLAGLWRLQYGFQNVGGLYFEELPIL